MKVMMLDILSDSMPKRSLTEEDHPVEAFIFDRSHESFGFKIAKLIDDEHEANEYGDPDSQRDRMNSTIGRQIGQYASDTGCPDQIPALVEQALRRGLFYNENLADPMHHTPYTIPGALPPPAYQRTVPFPKDSVNGVSQ